MKKLMMFILAMALAVSAQAASISPAAEKTLQEMLDPSGKIYMWNTNKHAVPPLAPAGMSRIYLDSTDLTMKMSINGGAYSDILTGTAGVLSPSHGGTGTSTVFTAGSVVFSGASGIYTQDNATFFYDNATDSLGLGTPTPSRHLHLYTASDAVSMFKIEVAGTTLNPVIELQDSTSAQTRTGAFNFLNSAGAAVGQISYGFSTNSLGFRTNSAMRWSMDSSGNFLASTDNSWDIGATGATRPRTGYFGTSVITPSATISGMTLGSVLFAGSGGLVSQDNSNLFWDDSNNRLGIGTSASPQSRLHVVTDTGTGFLLEETSAGGEMIFRTLQSSVNGMTVGRFIYQGYESTNTTKRTFGEIRVVADNVTDATKNSSFHFYTTVDTASFNSVESMTIYAGKLGLNATSPTKDLSLGGDSARTIWMERHTTANTSGNNLILQSGGATSGATNKSAGTLYLESGVSTGSGTGSIIFSTSPGVAAATSDNTLTDRWQITGSGNFIASTDNVTDIGASAATRARTGYFGTSVVAPQVQSLLPVHQLQLQTAAAGSVFSTETFDLTNGSSTTGVMFEFDVKTRSAADLIFNFGTDVSNHYRVTFESDNDVTIRKVISGVVSIITSTSTTWTNNADSIHVIVYIVSDSITYILTRLDGTRISLTGAVDTGSLPLTSTMVVNFINAQHVYNFRFHQSVQVPIFGDANYYDYQNSRLGLGTRSPTNALSLSGGGTRKIWMERHTTANTAGNSLTIQAGSATSAATNKDGGPLGLAAGIPTGTGRSQIRLKGHTTSLASGTTDGTEVDRLVVNGYKALSDNSPVALFTTTVASNAVAAGVIRYAIEVFDGTELQVEEGQAFYHITNKGGVIANNEFTVNSQQALTSGTLSVTFAISAAATASVSVNANSSLTPSAGYPRISYTLESFLDSTISLN